MLANYHTHTVRCNHAVGTERQYIEAAIKNGFKILGFSDHAPQPYPPQFKSHIRMGMEEVEDYTNTLVKLKDEYKSDIKILIGYEVEYSRKYFDELIKYLKQYPLDYIIQGQHYVPNEIDGFYAGTITDEEAKLAEYVDVTIEGMQTGLFSYLAHPDLIYYDCSDEIYEHHMTRLIQAAKAFEVPLEVNMLGFQGGRNYPSDKFFSLAKRLDAQFVIGCDAHDPMDVIQPEDDYAFKKFLNRHKIDVGDNVIKLRHV